MVCRMMHNDDMQTEAAWTAIAAACGHTTHARLSTDPQRAATEIAQLALGNCARCAQAARFSLAHLTWADVNR